MEGEVFYNENKCNGLIKVLSKLEKNKVVCVDGKWGTGKSYFCKKLIELSKDKLECINFNAFEHDHSEDPLVLLLSEFSKAVPVSKRERYIKKVAKHAAPLMGKGLDYALTLSSLKGIPGVDEVSDKLKNHMEQRINNYLYAEKSVVGIKRELMKIVSANEGRRIVVVIDELDRCRPSFALEIIEKIKHVFNVEGIHFVLSMNKVQVLESISHAYGIDTNSESYLEKFIDFTVRLTPEVAGGDGNKVPQADYAYSLAKRSFEEIDVEVMAKHIANFCAFLAIRHAMGFREVDRFVDKCLTAYISYGDEDSSVSLELLAFAIVGNTFLSINSPIHLKTDINRTFKTIGSVSRLVCELLIRGDTGSSSKQLTKLGKPTDKEEVYSASLFCGLALCLHSSDLKNSGNSVFVGFGEHVLGSFEPEEIIRSFVFWQSHLKKMS